jgi:hypothetical protein
MPDEYRVPLGELETDFPDQNPRVLVLILATEREYAGRGVHSRTDW